MNHLKPSEYTLHDASAARNLGGMSRTSATPGPGPMVSSGLDDKVTANAQPMRNALYQGQGIQQNSGMSNSSGVLGDAKLAANNMSNSISDKDYEAERFRTEYVGNVLYATESGSKMMEIDSMMRNPIDQKMLEHDMAVLNAQQKGLSPDLGEAAFTAAYNA